MRSSHSGNISLTLIITFLLVLVVALAATVGIYGWQHSKVNSLNRKVSTLNADIKNLNGQILTLSGQLNQVCQPAQQTDTACASYVHTSTKGIPVIIYAPTKNSAVANPVAVIGEVPGNWSTEAQFPVQLKDSKGSIVAQASAYLLGNWQTTQLVPFSVQLTFTTLESGSGTLVLQKDNPSGLSKNSDFVTIPIKF